jgi:hypothetical protein
MDQRKELTIGLLEAPETGFATLTELDHMIVLRDLIQISLGMITIVLTVVNFIFGVGMDCQLEVLAGLFSFTLTNLLFVVGGMRHLAVSVARRHPSASLNKVVFLCSAQLFLASTSFALTAGNFGLYMSHKDFLPVFWITSFALNFGIPLLGIVALYTIMSEESVDDAELIV